MLLFVSHSSELHVSPKPKTDTVVQVIDEVRHESIESDLKTLSECLQIHGLARLKEVFRERKFLEISADGLNGFRSNRQRFDAAGHLYPPDLLPSRNKRIDGCGSLIAVLRFLDVPGLGIGKEIEERLTEDIIDRCRPCHVVLCRGNGHGALTIDETLCQKSEIFLGRRRVGMTLLSHGFLSAIIPPAFWVAEAFYYACGSP